MFVCEKCNREFEHEKLLLTHKKIFHKINIEKNSVIMSSVNNNNMLQQTTFDKTITESSNIEEISADLKLNSPRNSNESAETSNILKLKHNEEVKNMGLKDFVNKIRGEKIEIQPLKQVLNSLDSENYQYLLKLKTTSNELMNKMSIHFEDLAKGYRSEGYKAKLLKETKILEGEEE